MTVINVVLFHTEDLEAFLGSHAPSFAAWLFQSTQTGEAQDLMSIMQEDTLLQSDGSEDEACDAHGGQEGAITRVQAKSSAVIVGDGKGGPNQGGVAVVGERRQSEDEHCPDLHRPDQRGIYGRETARDHSWDRSGRRSLQHTRHSNRDNTRARDVQHR